MPGNRKSKKRDEHSSAGEDFSEVSSTLDSDDESVTQDQWLFPVVSPHTLCKEYAAVTQLKVGELQEQVKMLCLKNSELCAQARPGKWTGSHSVLSGNEKLISQCVKKFTVMNEMFMPSGLPMQKLLTNSMHAGRYDSDLGTSEDIIAEVYECLPESLHNDIANSIVFQNLFRKQLNSIQRSIIHQFQTSTAPEIFGHPVQYYQVNFGRADVLEFGVLLRFPIDTEWYPKFPPLLFPNKQVKEMKFFFQSIELTKYLDALFGHLSIFSNKPPAPKTQGKVWQVTAVTLGAIAFMAVLAKLGGPAQIRFSDTSDNGIITASHVL